MSLVDIILIPSSTVENLLCLVFFFSGVVLMAGPNLVSPFLRDCPVLPEGSPRQQRVQARFNALQVFALMSVFGVVVGWIKASGEIGPWFAAMLAALAVILAGYLFGTYRICKGAGDAA